MDDTPGIPSTMPVEPTDLSIMDPDPCFARRSKEATWNEFSIIMNVLRFMDTLPKYFLLSIADSRRNQLSGITGVSHPIAQKVIDYYVQQREWFLRPTTIE
jgi:hypothetical protein